MFLPFEKVDKMTYTGQARALCYNCCFLLFFIDRLNNGGNVNNQPSTDVIQLTLTQKMTTPQVVETSATVNNSPIQDYVSLRSPGRSNSTYLVIFRQHIYCIGWYTK